MAERTGKQLAIYLPAELYDRLDASARRNHRTKTVQVVLALEAFLAADEAAAGIDGKAPANASDATPGKASPTPAPASGERQRGKGAGQKGKGG
jgi:predicted transcriptional regulator